MKKSWKGLRKMSEEKLSSKLEADGEKVKALLRPLIKDLLEGDVDPLIIAAILYAATAAVLEESVGREERIRLTKDWMEAI